MPLSQFFDLLEQRKAARLVFGHETMIKLRTELRDNSTYVERLDKNFIDIHWIEGELRKLSAPLRSVTLAALDAEEDTLEQEAARVAMAEAFRREGDVVVEQEPDLTDEEEQHAKRQALEDAKLQRAAIELQKQGETTDEHKVKRLYQMMIRQIEQHMDKGIESERELLDYEEFLDTWTSTSPSWVERHRLAWKGLIILAFFSVGPFFYCVGSNDDMNAEGVCTNDQYSSGLTKAFYFAAVTLTTVGYGDVVPMSDSAKVFTCVYIFVGLGLVANAIMDAMADVLEWYADRLEAAEKKRREQEDDFLSKKSSKASPDGASPKFGRFNTVALLDEDEDDGMSLQKNDKKPKIALNRSATMSTNSAMSFVTPSSPLGAGGGMISAESEIELEFKNAQEDRVSALDAPEVEGQHAQIVIVGEDDDEHEGSQELWNRSTSTGDRTIFRGRTTSRTSARNHTASSTSLPFGDVRVRRDRDRSRRRDFLDQQAALAFSLTEASGNEIATTSSIIEQGDIRRDQSIDCASDELDHFSSTPSSARGRASCSRLDVDSEDGNSTTRDCLDFDDDVDNPPRLVRLLGPYSTERVNFIAEGAEDDHRFDDNKSDNSSLTSSRASSQREIANAYLAESGFRRWRNRPGYFGPAAGGQPVQQRQSKRHISRRSSLDENKDYTAASSASSRRGPLPGSASKDDPPNVYRNFYCEGDHAMPGAKLALHQSRKGVSDELIEKAAIDVADRAEKLYSPRPGDDGDDQNLRGGGSPSGSKSVTFGSGKLDLAEQNERERKRKEAFVSDVQGQIKSMLNMAGGGVRMLQTKGSTQRFGDQLHRAGDLTRHLRPRTGTYQWLQNNSSLFRKADMWIVGETELQRKISRLTYTKVLESACLIFFPIILGMIVVSSVEGVTFVDALYWSTVSVTTVGYGDVDIKDGKTRMFCVFFLMIGCGMVAAALTNLASLKVDVKSKIKEFELKSRKLTPELLAQMDTNGDGVDEFEFCLGTLVAMEKVTREDLDPIFEKFHELDHDGSGVLTKEDLLLAGEDPNAPRKPMTKVEYQDFQAKFEHRTSTDQGGDVGMDLDGDRSPSNYDGPSIGGSINPNPAKRLNRQSTQKNSKVINRRGSGSAIETAEIDDVDVAAFQNPGDDQAESYFINKGRPGAVGGPVSPATSTTGLKNKTTNRTSAAFNPEEPTTGLKNKTTNRTSAAFNTEDSDSVPRVHHMDTDLHLMSNLPVRKSSAKLSTHNPSPGVSTDSTNVSTEVVTSARSTPKPIPKARPG
ncbi:unnamed protein product [Amoebophrya sp. A120]|nr:unnamed protein product [Amoebophrya sp. A120]|eukprot:GSA120T00010709001.1